MKIAEMLVELVHVATSGDQGDILTRDVVQLDLRRIGVRIEEYTVDPEADLGAFTAEYRTQEPIADGESGYSVRWSAARRSQAREGSKTDDTKRT